MKKLKSAVLLFLSTAALFTSVACTKAPVQSGYLPDDYDLDIRGSIKISTLRQDGESGMRSIKAFVSAFEAEYPNTTVTVDASIAGQADTATRISSGDIGDVFFFWEEDTYKYATTNNVLMNLTSYMDLLNIDLSNIYSGTIDLGRVDNGIYMIARDHTHIVLFYNKDAIVAEGLTPPLNDWTWDDFKDICRRVTKVGDDGNYTQIGAEINFSYAPVFIPVLQGWGGNWCDITEKKIDLTSTEIVAGLAELISLMEEGCIYPTGATSAMSARYAGVLGSKESVVFTDGVFPGLDGTSNSYENLGIDWDIASWFKYPTHAVGTGATGYGVYNRTTNPDAAAALATFLYTEAGQRAYNGQIGGSVPNVKSLAEDTFWRVGADASKNFDAFTSHPDADVVGKVECRMPFDVSQIIKTGFASLFANHFSGRKDFRDSLAEMEERANQMWLTLLE